MEQTALKRNAITEGVIWKQLLLFFFPILIGTFFQQLYNTADAVIVGNYIGKDSLAAVGTTGTLTNLLVGFFVGLASGATVIISQYYGAQDTKNVSKAVHTSVALALAGGILITVTGLLTAGPALKAIDVPDDIFADALIYLQIYYTGMLASMLYNVGTGVLRAIGDSRSPLYILIVSCVINILLDLLFVAVFSWGVAGAAAATVISQVFSAVLIALRLTRTNELYKVYIRKIRFHRHILKNVIKIGFPAGLQSVMFSISNILVQASVNSFGTDAIAAWTVFGKIDSFAWMIMGAFGISITTFTGQNFGAKKYDRVKRGTRICLLMTQAVIAVCSVLLFLFVEQFFYFFTDDPGVIELGVSMLRILSPTYCLYVFIEILSSSIRGVGEATKPTLIIFFGICVLRVLWILFILPLNRTIAMVALNYPVTWAITAAVFIIYYLRGNWLKRAKARQESETAAS